MIILAVLDKSLTKYNRLQSHGRLTLVIATLTTSCREFMKSLFILLLEDSHSRERVQRYCFSYEFQ